jgi:hypothetical protein
LLKAFVYKALRRLKTLSDLTFEFHNNPIMSQVVGFDPFKAPPSIERFSEFLREHPMLFSKISVFFWSNRPSMKKSFLENISLWILARSW